MNTLTKLINEPIIAFVLGYWIGVAVMWGTI
jgi:hypothetical protein